MPDGMTSPEQSKSSIEQFRQAGGVTKLVGAEEGVAAARNFPQPEFRSELPDIRMQLREEFCSSSTLFHTRLCTLRI